MIPKQKANSLIRKFGTTDPFKIAENLDYIVVELPLKGVRGFHQYIKRNHIIYIDDSLSEEDRHWVCAHELGHIFLHPHLNKLFMANHTYNVQSKYEQEADKFAACLCYPADVLAEEYDGCTTAQIAEILGLPLPLIEYAAK